MPRRRRFERAQRLGLGDAGLDAAEDAEAVGLLEARQRARRRIGLEGRERGDRHLFSVARADLVVEQARGGGARIVADLRDHLVGAPVDGEAVHVVAGEQDAELAADIGEVEAEVRDALAVHR